MNLTFNRMCELKPLIAAVYELEAAIKNKTDLTINEALAVCSLSEGSLVQSSLGDELQLGATRTSRLVSSLLAKDLITIMPDPGDRRKNILTLTIPGEAAAARLKSLEPSLFPMTILKEVDQWLST